MERVSSDLTFGKFARSVAGFHQHIIVNFISAALVAGSAVGDCLCFMKQKLGDGREIGSAMHAPRQVGGPHTVKVDVINVKDVKYEV